MTSRWWRSNLCEYQRPLREAWERSGVDSAVVLVGEIWLEQHFRATEPFGVDSDDVLVKFGIVAEVT